MLHSYHTFCEIFLYAKQKLKWLKQSIPIILAQLERFVPKLHSDFVILVILHAE